MIKQSLKEITSRILHKRCPPEKSQMNPPEDLLVSDSYFLCLINWLQEVLVVCYAGQPIAFSSLLPSFGITSTLSSNMETSPQLESSEPTPSVPQTAPSLAKYWSQRYRLFSKFDTGIHLDDGKAMRWVLIMSCCNVECMWCESVRVVLS